MRYRKLKLIATITCFLVPSSLIAKAVPTPVTDKTKDMTFGFGVAVIRYNLQGKDGNEMLGSASSVQINIGQLGRNWFINGGVDINLGPNQTVRNEKVRTDFVGTGFSAAAGYNLSSGSMRQDKVAYGLSLALNYADLIGRSVSRSSKDSNGDYVDNYVIRVSNFMAVPGFFIAWYQEARPDISSPESLITRMEGVSLNIGLGYPVQSTYRAVYEQTSGDESSRTVRERGRFTGYSIVACLTSILGI
jgi:hypothetical protein